MGEVQVIGQDRMSIDFGRRHKSAWRGKQRIVPLGAQAQAVVRPWLFRATVCGRDWVFGCVTRSLSKAPLVTSLHHAVAKACGKAGVPDWHPNQLRHSFATRVRAALGLDAAQVALGHSGADVTQVYAAVDLKAAERVARELG